MVHQTIRPPAEGAAIVKCVLMFCLLFVLPVVPALAQESDTVEPLPAEPGAAAPGESVPQAEVPPDPPPDLFARDTYRIDTIVCPFRGQIEYKPGEIECGLLQVPENRENPASRYIELHFVKLLSRWGRDEDDEHGEDRADDEDTEVTQPAPGKRDDPVVYLTGGPGARATYYVKRFKDHGLLDHRDMYILEQRGIGSSGDFCLFYGTRKPALGDVATFEESVNGSLERLAECARNAAAAGVDLSGYNTMENARDVKALRRALGFEKWNVWGISYGSILGQAYLKEDPEGILAFALDAIMPLDIRESELFWRVAHWYDRDLRKMQEICDAQPACAKRYPDIGGRLTEAVASVIGRPIEVDVQDIESIPSGKARFFEDIVAFLPFFFFYEQSNYPGIPGLIYAWADAVLNRDDVVFKALATASEDAVFGGQSQGMANAIICIDGDAEAQARASKKDLLEHPVLGAAGGTAESWDRRAALCGEVGMAQRPAEQYLAVQSDLPGLIIEGDMDPITPPPNAKAILPGLPNATYVEFPYAGHGPSRSVDCAGDMLNLFYDNPTAEPDLSCVAQMEPPDIFAPLFVSTVVPQVLLMVEEDKKQLIIPAAWLGSSVLITLIAFFVLTFSPLARRLDRRRAVPAGAARSLAWLSATASVASLAVFGAAVAMTLQVSELLPLFGFAPLARWGAWLGLLAGVLGLLTVVVAVRTRNLPYSRLIGFALTGFAALGLGLFLYTWDLGPF
jgi:pimeloyl-ACP methyl ester carboxylesterase